MGEYAKLKSDGQEIKMGTCENMYYLRYEDRLKVEPLPGSEFGYRWRLPLPSEDGIEPGDYSSMWGQGYPLTTYTSVGDNGEDEINVFAPDPDVADSPGQLQIHHKDSGLLLSVSCYHGLKLPETGGDLRTAHFNGKKPHWWRLVCLRESSGNLFPVIQCTVCGEMFRCSWIEILPYIQDPLLRTRLQHYYLHDYPSE